MRDYLWLMQQVLDKGESVPDRTGTGTLSLKGASLMFDLTRGFPLVTTRKLYTKQLVGELLGFLRGYDNAADFRALGCKFWDANANEDKGWLSNPNRKGEDDLGRVYGVNWRAWESHNKVDGGLTYTDQIYDMVDKLKHRPHDRRILCTAYNPGELDRMALPPCHMFFQCGIENRDELVLAMYQRSCDLFLGVPYNIASYALLTHLLAEVCGLKPGRLILFMFDTHIYNNHLDQAREQLERKPLPLCRVEVPRMSDVRDLEQIEPHEIQFYDYQYHPPIKADMAVE